MAQQLIDYLSNSEQQQSQSTAVYAESKRWRAEKILSERLQGSYPETVKPESKQKALS